jgi:CRP-like cAMP-binding protein
MSVPRRRPAENSVLAALPPKVNLRVLIALEAVTLTFGEVLDEPADPIRYVYFPTHSLLSLLTLVEGRLALEVGMVGIPLALGIGISSVCALVQGSGTALRMTSARFRSEMRDSPAFQRELFRYTHFLMVQISQTAGCNRFHGVEERLARWLLMTRDRLRSNQFRLTQELLGIMLGVRRVGVTNAAGALQRQDLISYSRGTISILDGRGLEAVACPCHEVVRDAHQGIGAH